MDNVVTTFAMGVDDQFHARLHTRARTRDVPVLSTQFAPEVGGAVRKRRRPVRVPHRC